MIKNSLSKIIYFFSGTIRRQLITGVVLVHTVLMSLFIWDLTERQKELLLDRQTEQAEALANSIATSSAGWVITKDFSGLQEIIDTQSRYPELIFAMILNKKGKVLAHSNDQFLGKYLTDLPRHKKPTILERTPQLVDAISPIMINHNFIGWARVGLGQKNTAKKLNQITMDGIFYAVMAIIIGALFAWYMGTRVTRRLNSIQTSSKAVQAGDLSHRTEVIGHDEISTVATGFNAMLEDIHNTQSELAENQQRLKLVIDSTGVGIWDWEIPSGKTVLNERYANMLGYTLSELEPTSLDTWTALTHPDDISPSFTILEEYWSGATNIFSNEFRMKHKEGHWIWILDTGKTVEWSDKGEPTRMIGTHLDISNQKNIETKLRYQATHDDLTALANRKDFEECSHIAVKKAIERTLPGAILFIDLDRFKPVNDTAGHHAGDMLLQKVAKILKYHIRGKDLLARIGGDEFTVLLEDCSIKKAEQIAEKMRREIQDLHFIYGEHSFNVAISVGVASFGNKGDKFSQVINAANNACQLAKNEGRNRVHVSDPLNLEYERYQQEVNWVPRINKALSENRFLLYAQEILALDPDSEYKHYEILIRLKDEEGKIIPPAAFIPPAERYDLMPKIDLWVLETAFKIMNPKHSYSINLSGQSLIDKTLSTKILALAKLYKVDISKITLEITETAAIQDIDNCMKLIHKLKANGFKFSLDDFGSGLSSFSYLKNMPVDYLKIDGSFVKDIANDTTSLAMVKSINEVGHTMGLKTIAEFVENQEIYDKLVEMGVDYAQGYHVHKPQPLDEI